MASRDHKLDDEVFTMKWSKLSLLVGAGLIATACSDTNPVTPFKSQSSLGEAPLAVLQRATPGVGGSATQLVGKDGASISVGGVTVTIPAGALNESVAITVSVPAGRDVAAELLPHGITFKRPVAVTFSVRGTNAENASADDALAGAYSAALPTGGKISPLELFTVTLSNRTLTLYTTHFSSYQVVYTTSKGYILVGG